MEINDLREFVRPLLTIIAIGSRLFTGAEVIFRPFFWFIREVCT